MPPPYTLHKHVVKDCAQKFREDVAASADTHLVAEIVDTEA